MNSYKEAIVTDEGLRTQMKCFAEKRPINITRMAIGSGAPGNDEDIPHMSGLINEIMDIPIAEVVASESDSYVSICGILDSANVANSFESSELGLFIEGDVGQEILYCYTYSERAEFVPAGFAGTTMQYVITTLISRASEVVISLSSRIDYVLRDEFEREVAEIKHLAGDNEELSNHLKAELPHLLAGKDSGDIYKYGFVIKDGNVYFKAKKEGA